MSMPAPDRLLEFYRRYVGDPDRTVDVYVGFSLFFLGIALGGVGVVLFLLSTRYGDSLTAYAVREVAVVAAAVGLPTLLGSVVVLLPVDRRMLYVTGGGSTVCLAAVALFLRAYPYNWNVETTPDHSATGVAIYSLGIAGVIAATGGALVAHHVERTSEAASPSPEAAAANAEETVSDAAVRDDIERELADAELSWGGVEKTENRRLELETTAAEDVDAGNIDPESATVARANGENVDAAVESLQAFQGGNAETASSSGVDDQTAALRELRERQRAEDAAEPDGLVGRVRRLFRSD